MSALERVDRSRLGWWVGAALLGGALGYVVYSFVGTFVFGVFIYYATRPVYRRLKTRIRPPSLAAFIALVTLALPALLLLAYTIAVGLQELQLALDRGVVGLGRFEQLLGPYIDVASIVEDPESLLDEPSVQSALSSFYGNALGYLGFIGNAALHLFVMITISFYLLRDDHRLADWFRRRFSDERGVLEAYTRAVDRDFSNIFFGNILNAVFTGIIGAIAYSTLDAFAPGGIFIPYPALLGLLTGVASLVPVVGIKLVYVPLSAWVGFQTVEQAAPVWFVVVFVSVSFVIVDVFPDLVLRPYVSGRGLHLGMVMLAYIFGPLLFGWYGIFLGPMLLVLLVHFVRLVLPELLAGEAVEPAAVGGDIETGSTASASTVPDVVDEPQYTIELDAENADEESA
jgi:predicted PurR-regulated permease PerM